MAHLGNYTRVSNSLLDLAIDIGPNAISIFSIMAKFANNSTLIARIRRGKIAKILGVSLRTVTRYLAKLRTLGFVKLISDPGESPEYQLNYHPSEPVAEVEPRQPVTEISPEPWTPVSRGVDSHVQGGGQPCPAHTTIQKKTELKTKEKTEDSPSFSNSSGEQEKIRERIKDTYRKSTSKPLFWSKSHDLKLKSQLQDLKSSELPPETICEVWEWLWSGDDENARWWRRSGRLTLSRILSPESFADHLAAYRENHPTIDHLLASF